MPQHGGDTAQWEEWAKRFPVGTNVAGEVLDVWHVGAHIQLDNGPQALLLNSEMSWDRRVPDAREVLKPGKFVTVQVLSVEPWRQRLSVSLRRAANDPWKEHAPSYRKGRTARARVTQFTREDVLIEFEDHVDGFIPRDEMPRAATRAEEILEIGDWVEVKVIERHERSREVKASMKLRMTEIEAEIRGDAAAPAASPVAERSPETAEPVQDQVEDRKGTAAPAKDRILVVEDDATQRLQLRAILEDLGFGPIAEAGSGPEAIEKASPCGYDVVFMDQEMPPGNGDAGIKAAEAIYRSCQSTKIVLVTGNRPPAEAHDFLCGVIAKPFQLERIRNAMRQLEETGNAGWAEVGGVLADEMPQGTEFIGKISRTGHTTRPLGEVLTEILSGLREATGSRATAIFGWNRSTKEVTLEASWGLQRADFDRCRPNLHKSPVADLVYQPELPLLYSNLDEQSHGKFLYLRGILGPALDGGWPLQSCIGLYVCEELDIAYTLFVFGDRIDAFHSDASILSRAAASVAQAAIREHWIVAQVVSERRLTTLGGIVTSATHELRGRLNALEAVNSVDRSWKLLRTHPEKLRDPVFIAKMEERVGGLKKARQSMESVVGRILGWVRTEDDSLLNLRECLGRVLAAAYDVATKHKVEIAHDLGYAPEIRSNAVDLEQAFLNIVLNGVLHMKGTGRQGGRLTIQLKTLDPPKGPIQIRFTDTGPGIHSRLLDPTIWGEERIFNPLFTTKQSGTGMGLYIVRGLLANHGATVRVEKTAIWAGTTFLVEIPLHRAKTEENQR